MIYLITHFFKRGIPSPRKIVYLCGLKNIIIMTELVIEVEDKSILASLKKILSNLDGVKVRNTTRRKKTGLELALEDVEAGRVTEWESIDAMFDTILEK